MPKKTIRRTAASFARSRAAVVGGLVTAAAAGITYSRLAIDHEVTLPEALNAERRDVHLAGVGRMSAYVDEGSAGRPARGRQDPLRLAGQSSLGASAV